MASFIQRKKRGIFTVTRNLSTGAVRTSSSTSTGGKNGSVRITRSIGTTGNRIYKTIRVGNAMKRTYTTTPRTKKKRGAAKDGDTIATTIILIGCLIVWGIIYAWAYILSAIAIGIVSIFLLAYILSAIAIGIVSIFLLELIRGSKKPPVIESTEQKPLADK